MKKLLLLLLSLMLFASCSNDDDTVDTKPHGTISFDLNGEKVVLTDLYENDLKRTGGEKYGIQLYGVNYLEENKDFPKYTFQMYLEGPNEIGIYHLSKIMMDVPDRPNGGQDQVYTTYYNEPELVPGFDLVYNLDFTEKNKITGTFSCEVSSGQAVLKLTDGVIDYTMAKK